MSKRVEHLDINKIIYKKKNKNKWDWENQLEIENKYMKLKMLAISVFEWENLPSGIDYIYMERIIYEYGMGICFQDEDMKDEFGEKGTLFLPVALNGRLNLYGIPRFRKAYAENTFYQKHLTDEDSVILYDNVLKVSIDDIIYTYAKRLANVERIIDVNLNSIRHPQLISTTSQKNVDAIIQAYEDINNNKPLIILDEVFSNSIKKPTDILQMGGELVVEQLMDYKNTLENEVLTFIGIGNSSQDKRERLVVKEMEIASNQNSAYANVRLKSRQQFCEKFNAMFGTNIKVKYSNDINSEEIKEIKDSDKKGGEENE